VVPASEPPAAPEQAATTFSYLPRMTWAFAADQINGSTPADCNIAAGPTHVVTVVNSQISFYTKSAGLTYRSSLASFFQPAAGQGTPFDPKVVYDEASGRFFIVALTRHATQALSNFQLGASVSSDPNDGWSLYEFANQRDGEGIDYEQLGFGPRGVYLTGNYIRFQGWPAPAGNHANGVWTMDKNQLTTGQNLTIWYNGDVASVSGSASTMKAAICNTAPPAGLDGLILSFQPDTTTANVVVHGVTLPGNFPAAGPTFTMSYDQMGWPGAMTDAQQQGGLGRLQATNIGSPPLDATYRGGRIYSATHLPNGSFSLARLLEVDVSAWPSLSLSYVDYSGGSTWYFWPAATANAFGDVALVFSHSDAGRFASSRWAVKPADAAIFLAGGQLAAGLGYHGTYPDSAQHRFRWGDYAGAAVDPVDQGLWVYNMEAMAPLNNSPLWSTTVGYIPRAVYADAAYVGVENGSRVRPFDTVGEAHASALSGNELVLRAGTYSAGVTLNKRLWVIPDGGTVQIGP
jgi:hypothetical protein